MSVRKETIILEMEDHASREALGAVGPFQALNAELEALDGRATTVSRRFTSMTQRADKLAGSMDKANASVGRTSANLDGMGSRGMVRFNSEVDRGTASIDRFSGRVQILGTAVLALGPSLLPIMGSAVPAIGALATGMVGATAAAATLVLAFKGVGGAVEAISAYRLEPTADNLAKVKQELEQLGPEGTQFVMALDEMRPALEDLQRLSRAGIFPGFTEGLDELVTRLPQVRDFVEDISTRVGNLGADTGDSLANDADWREFFAFVADDAGPAMEEWGRATGNFVAGAANMVEALSELSGGVTGDVLQSSRDFREWADNLEHTEGFQEFADYVRESGPQVADFLSSTAGALVAVATAAAPWGSAVLPILTTAADVFTAIAGSPLGPPLFAAAAGMVAFSKASALASTAVGRLTTMTATGGVFGGFADSARGLRTEMSTMASTMVTAGARSEREIKRVAESASRAKGHLRAMATEAGKAGPAIAGIGLLSTGTADKMGLTNTAMLAMAGSVIPGWGTAVGAATGLALDFAHANDNLKASIEAANDAMGVGDLAAMSSAVKQLNEQLNETTDNDVFGFDLGKFDQLGAISNVISPLSNITKLMGGLTGETGKAAAALEKLEGQKAALEAVAVAMGANRESATEMAAGTDRAQAAMKKLKISNEALRIAQQTGGVEFDLLSERIRSFIEYGDSAQGRTEAVGDAIANLGADALGTAHSAGELAAALDALITPEQNLIAAQDQLTTSIRHLGDDLDKQNKTLVGNSDAAIKNRAAVSGRVDALKEMITAEAQAGKGPEVVAESLRKQRQALIDSATAAGLNKQQIKSLLEQMNLTPELITTIFENLGIDKSEQEARNLKDRFDRLPTKLQTEIRNKGIPKSEADITRLTRKYHLTPDQVRTLAALVDKASGPIGAVLRELLGLDGQSATVTINTVHQNTFKEIHERIDVNADGGFHEGGVKRFADGGYGTNGRYYPRQPMLIPGGANILWGEKETGWEAYISGKPSERERNLEILAMAADRLGAAVIPAAIGRITAYAKGGGSGGGGKAAPRRSRDDVAAALWQSGHRDPAASLIAGMTVRQLARLGRSFDDLSNKRLGRFGRSMERATALQEKQSAAAQKRFDTVRDRRSQLTESITGGLRSDLWADNGGSAFGKKFAAGSISSATSQLRTDRARAVQFKKDIGTLRKKGLNGSALQEIIATGDYDRARMFASASRSAIGSFESAFNARQSATASAGRTGGQVLTPAFNALRAEAQRQNRELQQINKNLNALRKEQDHRHDAAQKSRKDNSAGSAARKGARDR